MAKKNEKPCDYAAMGRRIRELRKNAGMIQADLAALVGISTSFMGHIERGTRIASIGTIIGIAEVLDVSIDYLLLDRSIITPTAAACPEMQTKKMKMLNKVMQILDREADSWMILD